jgi:hypothetical protein
MPAMWNIFAETDAGELDCIFSSGLGVAIVQRLDEGEGGEELSELRNSLIPS